MHVEWFERVRGPVPELSVVPTAGGASRCRPLVRRDELRRCLPHCAGRVRAAVSGAVGPSVGRSAVFEGDLNCCLPSPALPRHERGGSSGRRHGSGGGARRCVVPPGEAAVRRGARCGATGPWRRFGGRSKRAPQGRWIGTRRRSTGLTTPPVRSRATADRPSGVNAGPRCSPHSSPSPPRPVATGVLPCGRRSRTATARSHRPADLPTSLGRSDTARTYGAHDGDSTTKCPRQLQMFDEEGGDVAVTKQ